MRGPAMSKAKFKYAIREAQSKSKQKEFGIEKSKYPRFRTNSDDLDFQSIFSIIEYAQNLLSDSVDQDLIEDISLAATYLMPHLIMMRNSNIPASIFYLEQVRISWLEILEMQ